MATASELGLIKAAAEGNLAEVNALCERGANPNPQDEVRNSSVNEAAYAGHAAVAARLLGAGAGGALPGRLYPGAVCSTGAGGGWRCAGQSEGGRGLAGAAEPAVAATALAIDECVAWAVAAPAHAARVSTLLAQLPQPKPLE